MSINFSLVGMVFLALAVSGCTSIESGMRFEMVAKPTVGEITQQEPILKAITPSLLVEENADIERATRQDIAMLRGEATSYAIGSGDLLSILVWNYPELNIAAAGAQALSSSGVPTRGAQSPSAYVVDGQGFIQFPYLGTVKVSGLTEIEARDLLSARLFKSIKKPDITLRVIDFRSKKIYVDGEVKSPGNVAIEDVPMTLLEALSRSGGVLATADQSAIVISRNGVSHPINIPALVRQGINPSDILLVQGDIIRVRNRDENKVFVLGEVVTPRTLPMINGRLTLTEALSEAGGISQISAAGRQVYVVRNAIDKQPLVFNLDARSPVALALADGFVLRPRDVVFVDASGLARFSRILSLILPNAASAASSYYNLNYGGK